MQTILHCHIRMWNRMQGLCGWGHFNLIASKWTCSGRGG